MQMMREIWLELELELEQQLEQMVVLRLKVQLGGYEVKAKAASLLASLSGIVYH